MYKSQTFYPLFLLLGLAIPVFYTLDRYIHTQYVFNPKELQKIAKDAIAAHGNSTETMMRQITRDLKIRYGDAVYDDWTREDWFFNNAGGAMGAMVILHASISEYLIFFGTALQTEGHSGIHLADDYFTILTGTQYAAEAGDLHPTIYYPGDQNHLKRGTTIQYSMPGPCFALELAQGWIPMMVPFGFADTFSSTFDFPNLWKTTKMTGGSIIKQAMRGKF